MNSGRTQVVRAEGFEPPRLASLEPKSSASTNSATPARLGTARRVGRAARLISRCWRSAREKWSLTALFAMARARRICGVDALRHCGANVEKSRR